MKKIISLSILSCWLILSYGMNQSDNYFKMSIEQQKAFEILDAKCNSCHINSNPSKYFTLNNMNGFAKNINRQVFFWKRMPKGNKMKLTIEEKQILKTWLNNQLKKQ